jgi:hypothetical protein
MPKHVLLMLAECKPGTEDEFNDWYTNVHLAEVLRADGFVAAQRFRLADTDPPQEGSSYLAIYEVEADTADEAMAALAADKPNRGEPVGLDRDRSKGTYYTAVSERVTADSLAAQH